MSKDEDNLDMRILKKAACKTLSGKSTLTYQIGALPDNEIHIQVLANDGGGMFSQEWVSFEAVQAALENDDEGAAITSIQLTPLFKGKSVNTPSFLLAALKHLKLVRPMQGKQRHHERMNPGPFLAGSDGETDVFISRSETKGNNEEGNRQESPEKKGHRQEESNTLTEDGNVYLETTFHRVTRKAQLIVQES